MKLLTKEIEERFKKIGSQENIKDPQIIVKFFSGSWTWYATEYDQDTKTFFGLVEGHDTELGYFSLEELESVKGPLGLGIERDIHYGFNNKISSIRLNETVIEDDTVPPGEYGAIHFDDDDTVSPGEYNFLQGWDDGPKVTIK